MNATLRFLPTLAVLVAATMLGGSTASAARETGMYLTGPATGDAADIARAHVQAHRHQMGLAEEDLHDMVLSKRASYEIKHHASESGGFCTLQEDGIAKALLGLTSLEEVVWHTPRGTEQNPHGRVHTLPRIMNVAVRRE